MSSAAQDKWVEQARSVRIEDEIVRRGIKLKGRIERCGPCPVCGGDDRFSISTRKKVFNCRVCKAGGNVIGLVQFIDGCNFAAAVETLTGEPPPKAKANGKAYSAAKPRNDAGKIVVAEFPYHFHEGGLAFVVERIEYQNADGSFVMTEDGKRKKTFRQKRPDPDHPGEWLWNVDGIPPLIYRLPEVTEAIASGHVITIVEGEAKADLLCSWHVPATCCSQGAGKWKAEHSKQLRDADIIILPDNDERGREHCDLVGRSLRDIAASVRVLDLPSLPPKNDIIDWAQNGGTVEQLHDLIAQAKPWTPSDHTSSKDDGSRPAPRTLAEVHEVFRRWFGDDYDLGTLDAMLAVSASERLPGDPAWLLIISGPGNTKTETVQATSGLGAHVVSTIVSEGALLSASSRQQRAKNATGGLLRKIGERGLLVIKDVTSILSADRNARGPVLAALREVHDGHWVRNVGIDGGQTLEWRGRITVIGACTTAWDQAHAVISTMGDRFVLVRSNSRTGRIGGGLRAVRNTGSEVAMRHELADAVAGLINSIDADNVYVLTDADEDAIVRAADLVTLARTGVEIDYRGKVVDAHAPEMPTRMAKQLTQIMRGAIAIGMDHESALQLVIRCARDSMPQLRLAMLLDLASYPNSRVIDIRRRLQRPRMTTDRTLQALHMLGLLTCREEEDERAGKLVQIRFYSLAGEIDPDVLQYRRKVLQ